MERTIIPRIPYDVGAESEPCKYAGNSVVDLGNGETYDMNSGPPPRRRKLPPIVFADGSSWEWPDRPLTRRDRRELLRLAGI